MVHESGNFTLFLYLFLYVLQGLAAVQIMDTFGFPKQAVFLKAPKLPDYLVIILLMPKACKAVSEIYSCTQMS